MVLVPLLFVGMQLLERDARARRTWTAISLGEPLLFKLATWLQFGHIPDGYSVNIHPMVFAAWFGMLATAWNLLPFGQLDGGHLTYATPRRSVALSSRSRPWPASIVMCFISDSWMVMTVMMLAMLYFLGPRHPRVLDEYEPLGRGRYALVALRDRDVHPLLHAGADRSAVTHRRKLAPRASLTSTLIGSTSTIVRRFSSGRASQDGEQRLAHRVALRALDEELRAVLPFQPSERRRRGAEHVPAVRRWPRRIRRPCAIAPASSIAPCRVFALTITLTSATAGG